MKTDNYLTLCLEQAAKSPLHYRHGCIIVRGGKVIGQGYNDYRPGFDGGALKNGRIAHSALDGPALADLKEKLKKRKQGAKQKHENQQHQHDPRKSQSQSSRQFVAFEKVGGGGGGHNINAPLSMHSEMMAIHSALAASSTLASTAFSREKPCFKLPRGDKRKERLRKDALKAYVERICETATPTTSMSTGKTGTAKLRIQDNNNAFHLEVQRDVDQGQAFHQELGAEKHQKGNPNGKKRPYEAQQQYDRYGRRTQPAASRHPSACKNGKDGDDGNAIRGYDVNANLNDSNNDMSRSSSASRSSDSKARTKKDGKNAKRSQAPESSNQQPTLVPKGETSKSRKDMQKRKKDPRLIGADLYVTRLGWNRSKKTGNEAPVPASKSLPQPPEEDDPPLSPTMTASSASLPSSTGSLHDELTDPSPRRRPDAPQVADFARGAIHASRPCYRCIAYMHAVGVKRVFWTNDAGEWEGGKVGSLVEAFEGGLESGCGAGGERGGNGDTGNGGVTGNGIFVTKHEVLMLKRMMGEGMREGW